jgi:beta-phosphoglucomutase
MSRDVPLQAVFFDFDGVIVNSEPLHFQAFQKVLASEHIDITEPEYYDELIGFDDKGAFTHIFKARKRDLTPATFLRVMTRKSEAMRELIDDRRYAALRGVETFVRGLWRKYPLAIVSGALREEIEMMLEGVHLRDCFPIIVAAEDVTVGKPDPEGYLKGVKLQSERIGKKLTPQQCLIVEDAPSVTERVKQEGFRVLAVSNSHPAEALRKANADYVVGSLEPAEVVAQMSELKSLF